MKCKRHPKYQGLRRPKEYFFKTPNKNYSKNPKFCNMCWEIYFEFSAIKAASRKDYLGY